MTNNPNRSRIAMVGTGFEQIGETVYLTRRVDLRTSATSYHVSTEPPRTNMSREVSVHGWCGTTNDVAVYGEGRAILTKWASSGDGRVHFRRVREG